MQTEVPLSTRSTSTTLCSQPIVSKAPPSHLRAAYFVSVWFYKGIIRLGLNARRLFTRHPKDQLRPEIKTYDVRPGLKNRIFRPQNSGSEALPLYLDVHGGGWAVADPQEDDDFCSFLAQNFNMIVVSVNYHKAPVHKFPRAVDDIAAIAKAVLSDSSLNIDKGKVALGGFSAGGNLAFAAVQVESIRGQIGALVGFYPALDLSETLQDKLIRRPKEAPRDLLASSATFLASSYIPEGIDLRNPLVSPKFASPKDMPTNAYIIGAEYDMLCTEAREMAESLANYSAMNADRTNLEISTDVMGWRQGGIRWECAKGKEHAFTHITRWTRKNEKRRVKYCQDMYFRVGIWLSNEVWAEPRAS